MRKRERSPLDFYRTPSETTRILTPYLTQNTYWEPCAGDGAICKAMPHLSWHKEDINPLSSDISQSDFLTTTKSKGIIVTNPPFSLAIPMIKHARDNLKTPAWWLVRVLAMSTKKNLPVVQSGLKKVIIISSLIKFETADGRIMNGNGTGQCGWFYFEPEYNGPTEIEWQG